MSFTLTSITPTFFPTSNGDGTYNQKIIVRFVEATHPAGKMQLIVSVLATDSITQVLTKCTTAANTHLTSLYGSGG